MGEHRTPGTRADDGQSDRFVAIVRSGEHEFSNRAQLFLLPAIMSKEALTQKLICCGGFPAVRPILTDAGPWLSEKPSAKASRRSTKAPCRQAYSTQATACATHVRMSLRRSSQNNHLTCQGRRQALTHCVPEDNADPGSHQSAEHHDKHKPSRVIAKQRRCIGFEPQRRNTSRRQRETSSVPELWTKRAENGRDGPAASRRFESDTRSISAKRQQPS